MATTDKLFIDFSLVSKHIGTEEQLNEINPGIGLSYFTGKNFELSAGYYNNSYSRPSFYFTGNYIPFCADLKSFNFKFGLAAGLTTGYKDGEFLILGKSPLLFGTVLPVLAPKIEVLFRPINTRFIFLVLGNALGLQVSYSIY